MGEIVYLINSTLDKVLPPVMAVLLAGFTISSLWRKQPTEGGLFEWIKFLTLLEALPLFLWVVIPVAIQAVVSSSPPSTMTTLIDWGGVFISTTLIIYWFSHEHSGYRGVITVLWIDTTLLAGWLIARWLGLLFISIPLLVWFYRLASHIALIVLPSSNPDDAREKRERVLAFLSYLFGVQRPFFVTIDGSLRGIEKRIPGDLVHRIHWVRGLIWTKSHQVVGITIGKQFQRVDGPGVIFLKQLERPLEVVDLRTQLRSSVIEAVTQDGIPIKAVVFASFAIDRRPWTRQQHEALTLLNPALKDARTPDVLGGRYPFSRARVRAALTRTSILADSRSEECETPPLLYWDDWVLKRVEEAARHVLAQRTLDELWRPKNDFEGANALNEIADAIRQRVETLLQEYGIQLFSARVARIMFWDEMKEEKQKKGEKLSPQEEEALSKEKADGEDIIRKQIAAWRSEWERRCKATLTQGKAEAERLKYDAQAYAYLALLTAIAESLREIDLQDPTIPHSTIAIRFAGALKNLLQQLSEETATGFPDQLGLFNHFTSEGTSHD
ncbi:MAG: hypothetical protein D6770_01245 [Anaerolineae bacterium]|nr:MAG: hypothetical protein D6770_01245 [Anaerolineae bacterium]